MDPSETLPARRRPPPPRCYISDTVENPAPRPLPWTVALALLASPAWAQLPVEAHPHQIDLLPSADAPLAANKRLVFDFWREVVQAHRVDRASAYLAKGFVDHGATGAGDRDAFVAGLGRRPPEPVKATIDDLVSIVAERDIVVLAFRRELPDLEHEGQTYTTTAFEMLRLAQRRIVERWSNEAGD
jgi:predicted SnoaL-like aldol condensation-catalyzing enzyme